MGNISKHNTNMIQLKRYGRWYRFEGNVDLRLEKVIDKKLSYVKKGAHFMPNPLFGIVHLYNMRKHSFPVGLLDLVVPILDEWKKQKGEEYEIEYIETIPLYKVQTSSLRDYQENAFNQFLIDKKGQYILPTASGKTALGERMLASCSPFTNKLVIVPTKELVRQWKDTCYGPMNVSEKIKTYFRVDTFQKIYSEIKKDNKKTLEELKNVDIVIWDELQHIAAKTLYTISMKCDKAIMVGLSATPFREDGADLKIHAALGPIVYQVPTETLTKQGYLTPVQVEMIEVTPKPVLTPEMDYHDIYFQAILRNPYRNTKIVEIANKESKNGLVLILFDSIEHGETIYKLLEGKRVAFIHGKTKDRENILKDIKEGKYNIVLASRVYNEGINIESLKTLIIAGGGQSSTRLIQQVGRVLRLYPNKKIAKVYDFMDRCRILKRHSLKRIRLYKENGWEVKENEQ